MDFLGAMFEGIGKTFEAGANVNLGQMNERNVKRQIAFGREQLEFEQGQSELGFIMNEKAGDRQLLLIAAAAAIILVIVAIIFRS